MHPILSKTFGGLSKQYYLRQFFFGVLIVALVVVLPYTHTNRAISIELIAISTINTILYPYSRFVYESIIEFIMGENVFFINAIIMLITKIITMCLCWCFAIFIAPIGLAYLYYHHSKSAC